MFKRNVFDSLFLFLGLDPKEIIREVHKDSHCNILPTAKPGNNPDAFILQKVGDMNNDGIVTQ